ncbi:RagB/SusD family nutrient uptake outer membrane protein [Elizabethkingia anophelis]|nr:RagB/SusD family nutrient uptake outer membrane protein [Elizabethkingia anophelis]BBQ07017.1 membrane protein [Elizabethkingia anophelis]
MKKMKKIRYFIIGLSLAGALVTSCNNMLDQTNPNLADQNEVIKTLDGLEAINRGFYLNLPTSLNYYMPSLITDEFVYPSVAGQNLGGGLGEYLWEYSPGTVTDRDDTGGLYRGFYNVIKRANITLENIDGIQTTDTAKKNLVKAEALGMRALAHYYLLVAFSPTYNSSALGCAYVTSSDDYIMPSRLSMKDSYDKVNADLDQAIALFPTTLPAGYGGVSGNNRITKAALYATKAKVALEIGNYDVAISNATSAIGSRTLVASADFNKLWDDSNDFQEVILKQSNISGAGNVPGQLIYNTQGQVQWTASATLRNKYTTTDVRGKLFLNAGTRGFLPSKYILPNSSGVKPTRGMADVKLLRIADMYLIRAEAYAQKGDLISSFNDYKLLRDARLAGASVAFTSKQDALDNILDERGRELCYEGSRLNDLKRMRKTIKRVAADSRPGMTQLEFTNVDQMTLPIPQAEMFANPNMKQNVGWSGTGN